MTSVLLDLAAVLNADEHHWMPIGVGDILRLKKHGRPVGSSDCVWGNLDGVTTELGTLYIGAFPLLLGTAPALKGVINDRLGGLNLPVLGPVG